MEALSYEGPEKFIFISYAHKDSDRVLKILEKLVENGYRIWYDDGIAPGSEWPEDIAQHLDSCAVFMAFVTNNSIASDNCRREVTFALNRRKPFLGILLEPTQMSLGMEMQLSAQQCILRYNYRRESDFIQKIFSCPDLECCKIQPEPEPEPEPVVVPAPVAVPNPEPEPAPVPVPVPVPAPKPKPVKKPKVKAPRPPRTGKKNLLPMILGGVAALIALLVLLFTVILPVRVTDEKKIGLNETYLTLQETAVTKDTVRQLNKLKQLETLNIRDCTVEDNALDGLKCPKLRSFTLLNTQVENYAFLDNSPQISSMTLNNCGVTDSNISLAGFEKLRHLNLNDNPGFTDLTVLQLPVLQELYVSRTGVTDVSCLTQAAELRKLEAAGNQITSIDALAGMEDLTTLNFADCQITAVTQPFMSLSMKEINMNGNGLTDLSGFGNFTVLREARLGGNQLTDVSWLEKNTAELKTVDLSENPLNMEDLKFLTKCPMMYELHVSGLPVEDLTFVAGMTELEILGASRCGLTKLPDLSGLTKLRKLYLDGNRLTDLTGLPSVGAVGGSTVLDLANNQLKDLSSLPDGKYYHLTLQGNPMVFAPGSLDGLSGDMIFMDYHESLLTCGGTRDYWRVYIQDVPADQQLKLKDVFSVRAVFVDRAGMVEALKEIDLAYPELN